MKTILWIDDDERLLDASVEVFREYGFELITATNTTRALTALNEQRFDGVLLDVKLRGGEDGLELLQVLYTLHPELKVVVFTGYPDYLDQVIANRLGASFYFTKLKKLIPIPKGKRDKFFAALNQIFESLPTQDREELPCALFLTALPVEFNAVCSFLENQQEEVHEKGTVYCRGSFTSTKGDWTVIVVETGVGNVEAGIEAERAINRYRPRLTFFVGIAGGVKDVRIGDVVVATKIYGYESGASGESFMPRPNVGESSYRLEQRARAEAKKNDWRLRIANPAKPSPSVRIGPIAAGEKVVKSTLSSVYRFLRTNYGDTLAVEMEGRGVLAAARANSVDALVVRGISDLIDKKEEADAGGSQHIAALHASAFAFEILAKL